MSQYHLESNFFVTFNEQCAKNAEQLSMGETEVFDVLNLLITLGNIAKYRRELETHLMCFKLLYFFLFDQSV